MTVYDPRLYGPLAEVEDGSFWFRARSQLILWALERYAPAGWQSLIEIGCGTGYVLRDIRLRFPEAELTGTDLFDEGLAYARDRVSGALFEAVDVLEMPHRDRYDVAGAFDVIEHIDDDSGALRGIHQALRPGGVAILTVPQHPALWSAQDVAAQHKRRYTGKDLRAKVEAAGFTVVLSTSFVTLLLPALLVTRKLPGRTTVRDLRHSAPVNVVLNGVMTAERGAIRLGATLPIGGSRLLVAYKG